MKKKGWLIDQSAIHLIMSSRYRLTRHTNQNSQQQDGHIETHDVQFCKLKKTMFQKISNYITEMSYEEGSAVWKAVPPYRAKTKTSKG